MPWFPVAAKNYLTEYCTHGDFLNMGQSQLIPLEWIGCQRWMIEAWTKYQLKYYLTSTAGSWSPLPSTDCRLAWFRRQNLGTLAPTSCARHLGPDSCCSTVTIHSIQNFLINKTAHYAVQLVDDSCVAKVSTDLSCSQHIKRKLL